MVRKVRQTRRAASPLTRKRKSPTRARKKPATKTARKRAAPKRCKYCIALEKGDQVGFWTGKDGDARKSFDTDLKHAAFFSDAGSANRLRPLISRVPRGWKLSVKKR